MIVTFPPFLVLHNLLLFLRAFSPCCRPIGALPQRSGLGLNLWNRLASILPNYRPQNWHRKSPLPRVSAITSVCLSLPLSFSSAKLTILVSTSPVASDSRCWTGTCLWVLQSVWILAHSPWSFGSTAPVSPSFSWITNGERSAFGGKVLWS